MKVFIGALILIFTRIVLSQDIAAELITGQKDLPGLPAAQQKQFLKSYWISSAHLRVLNEDARKLVYRMSARNSQSNCYYTSMLATGIAGLPERYMDLPEYQSLLEKNFKRRTGTDVFHPGDILRMKRKRGNMETHSVVYLGFIKDEPWNHLVLSKNGPKDGPYLIMNLRYLSQTTYPGSVVTDVYFNDENPSTSSPVNQLFH